MLMDNKAQLHTLEGLGAAVLITFTVLAITQSTMMVTPQNELTVNVQLEQMSYDALTVLDTAEHESVQCNLTECVAGWDTNPATYPTGNLEKLDGALAYLLPDLMYNVDFVYFKNGNLTVENVIVHGVPGENAVVAKRFVTLTKDTVSNYGGGWILSTSELRVVEVRLTTWKI
ncbi:MAG: hypothetical protein R2741_10280 [Methanolobus sp.]